MKFNTTTHRPLRLHEWLVLLLLMSLVGGVRADTVYRCSDGKSIAYQATPCFDAKAMIPIKLDPAPPAAASPQYAIDQTRVVASKHTTRVANVQKEKGGAYECRGSDGEVFYRLGKCPRSVQGDGGGSGRHGKHSSGSKSSSVSGHPVSREEACHEMRRAGSAGRKGHEFDEEISTYDKNLGRDPCKDV